MKIHGELTFTLNFILHNLSSDLMNVLKKSLHKLEKRTTDVTNFKCVYFQAEDNAFFLEKVMSLNFIYIYFLADWNGFLILWPVSPEIILFS